MINFFPTKPVPPPIKLTGPLSPLDVNAIAAYNQQVSTYESDKKHLMILGGAVGGIALLWMVLRRK